MKKELNPMELSVEQMTVLRVKAGDRNYDLHLSSESPLGECHDVLMRMTGFIVDKIVKAQPDQSSAQEKCSEENSQVNE